LDPETVGSDLEKAGYGLQPVKETKKKNQRPNKNSADFHSISASLPQPAPRCGQLWSASSHATQQRHKWVREEKNQQESLQ